MKKFYLVMIFAFAGDYFSVNAQNSTGVLTSKIIELKQNFPNKDTDD